jgi:anthranilate synthase component I
MFYLQFGQKIMIGASPELVFKLQDGLMENYPLAGTRKRGKTTAEDQALTNELLSDPKEIAEHSMLVDLHRNDIGRVAKIGTVKIKRLMDIKKFATVQHISSEIMGIIDDKHTIFTALASNFPAGTLSGAPKLEAIKIIQKLENNSRGPYGGAIGYFGSDGNGQFCIPIRSIFINGDQGFARAGGGIVYDSDPEAEYQEIINKLGAVTKTLEGI